MECCLNGDGGIGACNEGCPSMLSFLTAVHVTIA